MYAYRIGLFHLLKLMYTPTEEHFEDLTPKTSLPSPLSPWTQLNLVRIPYGPIKTQKDALGHPNEK